MALRRVGTVELAPARLSDARELAAMSRRYVENGLVWRWRTAGIQQHVRAEDSCVVVARDGERIVGFALMAFRLEERDAHLALGRLNQIRNPEQRDTQILVVLWIDERHFHRDFHSSRSWLVCWQLIEVRRQQ